MEMVLLITVREAVSLLHRTPARSTSSLRKYVTKCIRNAPALYVSSTIKRLSHSDIQSGSIHFKWTNSNKNTKLKTER